MKASERKVHSSHAGQVQKTQARQSPERARPRPSIEQGGAGEAQSRSEFKTAKKQKAPVAEAPQPKHYAHYSVSSLKPVGDAAKLKVDVPAALAMVETIRAETGQREPLKGKRFAVVLESEFIPAEQKAYAVMIRELGGTVDFASALWDQPKLTFFSDVQGDWNNPDKKLHLDVDKDIVKDVLPNLSKYSGVIFSANGTMKRLNFTPEINTAKTDDELEQAFRNRPLGRFVDAVMKDPGLVKAFNCHAIYALEHHPEHARGLTMAFNGVMAGEARLMGIKHAPIPDGVDPHQATFADGNVVSSSAGVGGGTEAMLRTLVQTVLKNPARAAD